MLCLALFCLPESGMEHITLCLLGRVSTPKLHPQPQKQYLCQYLSKFQILVTQQYQTRSKETNRTLAPSLHVFCVFLENNYFKLFHYRQFYACAQCPLILSMFCFALPCTLSSTLPFLPSSFLSFLLKKTKENNKITKSNWHFMLDC